MLDIGESSFDFTQGDLERSRKVKDRPRRRGTCYYIRDCRSSFASLRTLRRRTLSKAKCSVNTEHAALRKQAPMDFDRAKVEVLAIGAYECVDK
jgi:hypothetical protein